MSNEIKINRVSNGFMVTRTIKSTPSAQASFGAIGLGLGVQDYNPEPTIEVYTNGKKMIERIAFYLGIETEEKE